MAASSQPDSKKLQPGEPKRPFDLVRESWALYLGHARILLGYSAWLLVPMAVSVLASLAFPSNVADVASTVNATLGLVIGTWLSIVIISITPLLKQKKRLRPRVISKQAWRIFLPYLFLSIVINLLTGVGIILLVIPGLIIMARLSYAQILLVRERMDPMEAMKASLSRTKSHTWLLVKRLLYALFAIGLPYACIVFLFILGFSRGRGMDIWTFFVSAPPTLLEVVSFQFLDILFLPIFLIYWVLMYEDI